MSVRGKQIAFSLIFLGVLLGLAGYGIRAVQAGAMPGSWIRWFPADNVVFKRGGGMDLIIHADNDAVTSDPTIQFRVDSTSPDTKFTLGVDSGDSDKLKLEVGEGLGGASPALTVLSNGRMGMGTTAPDDFLHIYGGLGGLGLHVDSTSGAGVEIDRAGNSNYYQLKLSTAGAEKWVIGNKGESNEDLGLYINGATSPGYLFGADGDFQMLEESGGTDYGIIHVTTLTADRTYTFPDQSGTVALTSHTHGGSSDADTLDGLDSTAFLRSNATTNFTGTLGITFKTDWMTLFDVDGNITVADPSVTFDGASTDFVTTGDWSVNSDYLFVEKSSGNIGVGTSAPVRLMDMVSGSTTSSALHIGEAKDEGAYFWSWLDSMFAVGGGVEYVSSQWIARSSSAGAFLMAGGNFDFFANTGLTVGNSYAPTQVARISNTGRIGLGSGVANHYVDINSGAGTVDSEFHIGEVWNEGGFLTSTADDNLMLFGGMEWDGGSSRARATEASGIQFLNGNIEFYADASLTDGNTYTPSEVVRINSSGNVGIGTITTPEILTVDGNIELTGGTPTYKIKNVADPTADDEVATKGYVDAAGGLSPTTPASAHGSTTSSTLSTVLNYSTTGGYLHGLNGRLTGSATCVVKVTIDGSRVYSFNVSASQFIISYNSTFGFHWEIPLGGGLRFDSSLKIEISENASATFYINAVYSKD